MVAWLGTVKEFLGSSPFCVIMPTFARFIYTAYQLPRKVYRPRKSTYNTRGNAWGLIYLPIPVTYSSAWYNVG
ncbi:hypothetical protein GGS20DRAFT_538217 [Poronia punctata]|nr:hypothetical protein GGS20DRAFT_538217 [Poronia punctata]